MGTDERIVEIKPKAEAETEAETKEEAELKPKEDSKKIVFQQTPKHF